MITSLNSTNQLIFMMERCCVFFAMQTGLLNVTYTNFGFKGLIIIYAKELHQKQNENSWLF
jgi:hypothetical protein